MSLSIETRSVGDITILACRGRIVEGDESVALQSAVDRLLPRHPHIVVNLEGVSFVDSAGLGCLLRLHALARGAEGDLKVCAANNHFREVLTATKLTAVLVPYSSEADAITALYAPPEAEDSRSSLEIDVLCVHPSPDVAAYARELLKQAGYGTTTATNLSDGRVLLRATEPFVLLIPADWQSGLAALTGGDLEAEVQVVTWPSSFSTGDAGEAAQQLLAAVAGGLAAAGWRMRPDDA